MSTPPHHRRFYHSIRFKLLLVSLTLSVIPWAGYRYIQETEAFLRQGQEKVLLGTAQAVATVLHNRTDLFPAGANSAGTLYIHPLHTAIQLDGYTDDWSPYLRNIRYYGTKDKPGFSHILGQRGRHLYALFLVKDDRIVYRSPGSNRLDQNDHLRITMEQPDGTISYYQLATSAPGWVNAHRMNDNRKNARPISSEPGIKGEWQETTEGYTLEIRIPLRLLGKRISFSIADVDDPVSRKINTLTSTSSGTPEELGLLVTPSSDIEHIINSLAHENARIWVLDGRQRVLAQKGALKNADIPSAKPSQETPTLLHNLFKLILQEPTNAFEDEFAGASRLEGAEVQSALTGRPDTRRRTTPDDEAVILSAAWPIRSAQGVLGAVLVEQTTNAIQSLQNEALVRLFSVTLIFFTGTGLVLLGFATVLTTRIRKLRNHVEAAVTPDGRIKGEIKAGRAQDEIGDLGRSFSNVLSRLGEYNRYLEAMASRLAHELRTPLTIVKTSLENLELEQQGANSANYLNRAKDGAERLGLILHRMREATRLEQLLQQSEPESFDLAALVGIAAENYHDVYPGVTFETTLPDRPALITGTPDLISQALDKLISNAVDFHADGTPIRISLDHIANRQIRLSVCNQGPSLPDNLQQELFESMVSVRSEESSEPHLGLGLYLVRLICEFHGGVVEASNLGEKEGVAIRLAFPLDG